MASSALRIVIVGGVAGGASAATRARRLNEQAEIIVFEKDRHVSFANCGLPYYIGGEISDRGNLLVASAERLKRRFNIDVRIRQEVTQIDRSGKAVQVHDRETGHHYDQTYDKLILAPGAFPLVPPLPGLDRENVFTLRNLEDADRIKSYADRLIARAHSDHTPPKAIVVGAGFIGLEMIEQLDNLGAETSLVELVDQVLPPLDREMAHGLEEELQHHGTELHLGDGIKGLDATGDRASAVELNSGTRLAADLVVLGLGVRPNVELARSATLALGPTGAIAVNRYQQTSDPDIYAVGDACEYTFGPTQQPAYVPLAGPANRSGRVAAEHAATGACATPMAPVYGTAIVRVFRKTDALTGLSVKRAEALGLDAVSATVVAGHHAGYYPGARPMTVKLVYAPDTGAVLGAQVVGEEGVDKRIDVVSTLVRFGGTVRDLAGLDLAYAPPYGAAKDPLHMAAFAACNQLDGLVQTLAPHADVGDLQVVDVRTGQEVANDPVPGVTAIHIPIDELRQRIHELDPMRSTATMCASGQRGYLASRILQQHGFVQVTNLMGGVMLRRHCIPRRSVS